MKKEKRLLLARNIFTFSIIMIFTIIIVIEKKETIILPKVENKITQYIENTYPKEDLQLGKIKYNNEKYSMKVSSTKNKKRYFYIYYSNKTITDTYQEDYIKGKTLLTSIEKELQKTIKKKTNKEPTIKIETTLDQFTDTVRERIIKEDNLLELKIYIIIDELLIKNWNQQEILKEIENYISIYNKEKITPKKFNLTITNQKEITNSIEISNITSEFINNLEKKEIINDIINDRNTSLLKKSKITYKYKN